jgi:hypothetical protein
MLGDHSGVVPPDPIPNSEVKRASANGSVHPHARVGHRQAPFEHHNAQPSGWALCYLALRELRSADAVVGVGVAWSTGLGKSSQAAPVV